MPSMQEVLVAARDLLLANPEFSALVGTDVGKDAVGKAYSAGWIFIGEEGTNDPRRDPRNSSTSTVTLGLRKPWTSPNEHNTAEFKLLEVEILSDSTRPADKRLTYKRDAEFRCDRIASVVKKTFHDPLNIQHFWPNGVFIVSSALWTDLDITPVDNEDGLVAGNLSFALVLG